MAMRICLEEDYVLKTLAKSKKNDPPDELLMLHQKIVRDAFFERHFDRILYGGNLKYAPARHIVKGVNYGNADMPRGGLRIKNLGEIKEKRSGRCRH